MKQPLKSSTVTTTETYELDTDDIEKILTKHLKLDGNINFDWRIGQWVYLTVTVKKTEIIE